MDKRQNSFAKAKIQMILLEVQFSGEGNTLLFSSVANYDNNFQHSGQGQQRFYVPDLRLDSPIRNPYSLVHIFRVQNKDNFSRNHLILIVVVVV